MTQLTRTHTGIECSLFADSPARWAIAIKYDLKGLPPSSKLIVRDTTLDGAKRIADADVKKVGHICDRNCQGWKVLNE